MKILEIIDPVIQNKQYKGEFRPYMHIDPSIDRENVLGQGSFAIAKKDKSDPHMIIKKSKTPRRQADDPYWIYVKEIIKNKLWENPYFPRLYVLKNIKDETNQKMSKIQMEKLFPLPNNNKELLSIFEMIFNYDPKQGERTKLFDHQFARHIRNIVEGSITENELKNTGTDENFIEAIKILKNILKKFQHVFSTDIKRDNLMIRRTPYGLQLVFTDPFS